MRAVVQRVSKASVSVDDRITGEIGAGLLVLLGVEQHDGRNDLEYMVRKTVGLRIFSDELGKMNRSVIDVGGSVLAVSQFTLLGDTRKGNRPSFVSAAPPELARELYEQYVEAIRQAEIQIATGIFQADMKVSLVNDGPVTILLNSREPRSAT